MGNHYHLLVETPEANLVDGMKWLQGTYTQRYNGRHRLFWHSFQGGYKAVLVDSREAENYFQVVSTYIHPNSARAGLIRVGEEPLTGYRSFWKTGVFQQNRHWDNWFRMAGNRSDKAASKTSRRPKRAMALLATA